MISIIIVACNRWGDVAGPFVDSIKRYEPGVEVVLIDSNSPRPYAPSDKYVLHRVEEAPFNYARMLNIGAGLAGGDWLMFANDDILCQGAFSAQVEALARDKVYGPALRRKNAAWGLELEFIYGWYMLLSRETYWKIGDFDKGFQEAGFVDIEYCWRAQELGFELAQVELPFIHLADQVARKHRRMTTPKYNEYTRQAKRYFLQKVRSK